MNELTIAKTVSDQLTKNREAIIRSLPRGFNFDRMCRTAINAIQTTPAIAECSPASIFLGIVKAFTLGLEPNGALAEGYLVPFNNKTGKTAVFMPSYRGLINLAKRSGEITLIYAEKVCENDHFEVNMGDDKRIDHKPDMFSERGKVKGYYAVYKTKDDVMDFEVMTIEEIEKVRETSKAKNAGPWKDWYDEMAKKTVIKRLLKRAPLTIELAGAVATDHAVATGEIKKVYDDVIDIEGLDVPDNAPKQHFQQPQAKIQADTSPNANIISEAQAKRLYALSKKGGKSDEEVKQYLFAKYGINSSRDIPRANYEEICDWAEGK